MKTSGHQVLHGAKPAPAKPQGVGGGSILIDTHNKLEEADKLRKAGKLNKAARICQELLNGHPTFVGALHTLGLIQMQQQTYWPALASFVRAAMLNPKDWTIQTNLCNVYMGLGAEEMAAHTLERAIALKQNQPEVHFSLGMLYENQREYALAAEEFRTVLKLDPDHPAANHSLGRCCIHLGALSEAADALHNAVKKDPGQAGNYYHLGQLPASLVKIDLIKGLENVRDDKDSTPEKHAVRVLFAKGGAYDKAGQAEQAWKCLEKANRLEDEAHGDAFDKLENINTIVFDLEKARAKGSLAMPDDSTAVSLFVLGMSRSGKTTMENLLGQLDGVKRGYENRIVEASVQRTAQLSGLLTVSRIHELPEGLYSRFKDIYKQELDERAGATKVFTNTHPARITDVGRLAETVPNMRFAFVRRNVEDLAFRVFIKHYKFRSNPYAYNIKRIYRYYEWYNRMIDLWLERYPDICCLVHYSDMLADPRSQVAAVARLCGLQVPEGMTFAPGDDRDSSLPYREYLKKAL